MTQPAQQQHDAQQPPKPAGPAPLPDDVAALEHALKTPGFAATGPMCWGPAQWTALHQMLRGYPRQAASPEKQRALRQYVEALADLLPCSICATHWRQLAGTVDTADRFHALKWSIDAHNTVNARLGKPVLSYADAVKTLQAQCPKNQLSTIRPTIGSSSTSEASSREVGGRPAGSGGCRCKSAPPGTAPMGTVIGLGCGLAGAVIILLVLAVLVAMGKRCLPRQKSMS